MGAVDAVEAGRAQQQRLLAGAGEEDRARVLVAAGAHVDQPRLGDEPFQARLDLVPPRGDVVEREAPLLRVVRVLARHAVDVDLLDQLRLVVAVERVERHEDVGDEVAHREVGVDAHDALHAPGQAHQHDGVLGEQLDPLTRSGRRDLELRVEVTDLVEGQRVALGVGDDRELVAPVGRGLAHQLLAAHADLDAAVVVLPRELHVTADRDRLVAARLQREVERGHLLAVGHRDLGELRARQRVLHRDQPAPGGHVLEEVAGADAHLVDHLGRGLPLQRGPLAGPAVQAIVRDGRLDRQQARHDAVELFGRRTLGQRRGPAHPARLADQRHLVERHPGAGSQRRRLHLQRAVPRAGEAHGPLPGRQLQRVRPVVAGELRAARDADDLHPDATVRVGLREPRDPIDDAARLALEERQHPDIDHLAHRDRDVLRERHEAVVDERRQQPIIPGRQRLEREATRGGDRLRGDRHRLRGRVAGPQQHLHLREGVGVRDLRRERHPTANPARLADQHHRGELGRLSVDHLHVRDGLDLVFGVAEPQRVHARGQRQRELAFGVGVRLPRDAHRRDADADMPVDAAPLELGVAHDPPRIHVRHVQRQTQLAGRVLPDVERHLGRASEEAQRADPQVVEPRGDLLEDEIEAQPRLAVARLRGLRLDLVVDRQRDRADGLLRAERHQLDDRPRLDARERDAGREPHHAAHHALLLLRDGRVGIERVGRGDVGAPEDQGEQTKDRRDRPHESSSCQGRGVYTICLPAGRQRVTSNFRPSDQKRLSLV